MSAKKIVEHDPREDVRVYLGPTLHKRTLIESSLFRGGLSDHVTGLIAKIPELQTLIVSMADVVTTRRRVQTPGTEENRVYQYLTSIRFNDDGEVRE